MAVLGPKLQFFHRFWAKMAKTIFFRQNPKMSLPYTYEAATLCNKLEKSYERILRSSSNARTDESEFIGPKSASRGTKNHIILVKEVKNHEIGNCDQNLHSEPLKIYILQVWVGTQLKSLFGGVSYASWVRFVDLNMPNCEQNHGPGSREITKFTATSKIFTLNTPNFIYG